MQRKIKRSFSNCKHMNAKEINKKGKPCFLLICHQGCNGYRHFKAKLQILDPSEERSFNFHTLAEKLVMKDDAPPPSGMHGGVCEIMRACVRDCLSNHVLYLRV